MNRLFRDLRMQEKLKGKSMKAVRLGMVLESERVQSTQLTITIRTKLKC